MGEKINRFDGEGGLEGWNVPSKDTTSAAERRLLVLTNLRPGISLLPIYAGKPKVKNLSSHSIDIRQNGK